MTDRAAIPLLGDISRIALLGLLSSGPMHGYELRKLIERRHMERWADIQPGSIYAGLQRLAREGLVEEAGEERVGNRPPRTTYRITPAGSSELQRLLRRAWSEPALWARPVDVALSFARLLPPQEIATLLEQRLQALDRLADGIESARTALPEQPEDVRARVDDIFAHSQVLLEAEQRWSEQVLDRVRGGAYHGDRDATERRLHLQPGSEAIAEHPDRPEELGSDTGITERSGKPVAGRPRDRL